MGMPRTSVSSDKSLEEKLCQTLQAWQRKPLEISCARGTATELGSLFASLESPTTGDEASPNLRHERGFKCNAPRVSNARMGPRQGPVGKQRQQRQSSKGTPKMYVVDPSDFMALVHEHTSMDSFSNSPEVTVLPTSPLTSPTLASNYTGQGFMSRPSSPSTPHSIRSSSTSPLSSPHNSYLNAGAQFSPLQFHSKAHTEDSPPELCHTHHHPHPFLCNADPNPSPNYNYNVHQNASVSPLASIPCLTISSETNNTTYDSHLSLSILKSILLEDDSISNDTYRGTGLKM